MRLLTSDRDRLVGVDLWTCSGGVWGCGSIGVGGVRGVDLTHPALRAPLRGGDFLIAFPSGKGRGASASAPCEALAQT